MRLLLEFFALLGLLVFGGLAALLAFVLLIF
jgi:hypothetical protein